MPRRTRRRRAPARWSMSAASILPNSPSCWSRTSRCARARRAFYAGMAALADALAAHAPPEKPIAFDWPDAIRVDGGLVGGARLAWPDGPRGRAAGLAGVRRHDPHRRDGRGRARPAAAVGGARGGRLRRRRLRPAGRELRAPSDGACRCLAGERVLPRWRRAIWPRLEPEKGVRRDIDDNGDLLVRRMGKAEAERRALVPALAAPSWLDPATRRAAT